MSFTFNPGDKIVQRDEAALAMINLSPAWPLGSGVYTVVQSYLGWDGDEEMIDLDGKDVPNMTGWRADRFELAPGFVREEVREEVITLDPNDPFDRVLIDIVTTNRRKRADYTTTGSSAWQNFDIAEERLARRYGLDREKIRGAAVDMLLFTKDTRLDSITSNGQAQNEPAEDTLLDEAVYSIIRYGRYRYPDGQVPA